jgi:hypothetical protein
VLRRAGEIAEDLPTGQTEQSTLATIKKLQADARSHLSELVQRRKAGARYAVHSPLERVDVAEQEKLLADVKLWDESKRTPVLIPFCVGAKIGMNFATRQYLFKNAYWQYIPAYTDSQMKLLVQEAHEAEARKFARLAEKHPAGVVSQPELPGM